MLRNFAATLCVCMCVYNIELAENYYDSGFINFEKK